MHNWFYWSKLSATKEYAFLQALYQRDFPTPTPIDHNRHAIVMSLVDGFPLNQVRNMANPKDTYDHAMNILVRLAEYGLVHCDFNEFNIMINNETGRLTIIDFPQMISISHVNADELFQRDVQGLIKFFSRLQHNPVIPDDVPKLSDIVQYLNAEDMRLDVEMEASGYISTHKHKLAKSDDNLVQRLHAHAWALPVEPISEQEDDQDDDEEVDKENMTLDRNVQVSNMNDLEDDAANLVDEDEDEDRVLAEEQHEKMQDVSVHERRRICGDDSETKESETDDEIETCHSASHPHHRSSCFAARRWGQPKTEQKLHDDAPHEQQQHIRDRVRQAVHMSRQKQNHLRRTTRNASKLSIKGKLVHQERY